MSQTKVSKSVQDKTVKEIRKDLQDAVRNYLIVSDDNIADSTEELHGLYKVNVLSQELIRWIVM